MKESLPKMFRNYLALLEKVENRCGEILPHLADRMVCRAGCDGCCQHIGLFPVEAVFLATALSTLPDTEITRIRNAAMAATEDGPCPLLHNNRCSLYEARPVICRTHGFPVVAQGDAGPFLDFCPLNFTDGAPVDPAFAIGLSPVNQMLVAINRLFLEETGLDQEMPERIFVADALLMEVL